MMIDNSIFGMTRVCADNFYKSVVDRICNIYLLRYGLDLQVTFDKRLQMGEGKNYDVAKNIFVCVGVKNLTNVLSFGRVSDRNFIQPVITLYHEMEHVEQRLKDECILSSTADDIYCSVSRLSAMSNYVYYKGYNEGNYLHHPREIRAEHVGVLNAYQYIHYSFPEISEKDIENLFVNYVNELAEKNYFIKGYFASLEEIDKAFDDAFESSKTYQRQYDFDSNDIVCTHYLSKPNYQFLRDKFTDIQNAGYTQDKIIANLNLHIYPEFVEKFTVLKASNVDLSDLTLYGREIGGVDEKYIVYSEERRSRQLPEYQPVDILDVTDDLEYDG